jgi:hypothetical protein
MSTKSLYDQLSDANAIIRQKNHKIILLERDMRRAKLPPRKPSKTLLRQHLQAERHFVKTYAELIKAAGEPLARRFYVDVVQLASIKLMCEA